MAIIIGVVSILCGLSMTGSRSTSGADVLRVPENALRFGTVWADSNFSWTIPIKNVSDSQVAVESVYSSCGCTIAEIDAFSLKPGETRKIPLILDLVERSETKGGLRSFSVNIFVKFSAESQANRVQIWKLSGAVRDLLEVFPNELVAGKVVLGHQSELLQRMHVKSRIPLADLNVQTPVGYVATVATGSVSSEHTVELSLPPDSTVGRHEDTITLIAETKDATVVHVEVPVSYRVVQEIGFIPDLEHLGAVPVGTEHSAVRHIHSHTGKLFRVVSVAVREETGVEASAEYNQDELTLTCQPVRAGPCSFEVVVSWEAESTSAERERVNSRFLFQCVGVQHP